MRSDAAQKRTDTTAKLEALAQRQRAAFGYHMVDGLPVWNTPESDDHYTRDSYTREQHEPEE